VAKVRFTNAITAPYFVKVQNETGYPLFFEMPTATMFAVQPIRVPVPPKHAPNINDHQIGEH
jgi:hypothetical protein